MLSAMAGLDSSDGLVTFGTTTITGSAFGAGSDDFEETFFPLFAFGVFAELSTTTHVPSRPRSTTAAAAASQICPRLGTLGIATGRGAISVSGSVSLNSIKLSHFGSAGCGRVERCETGAAATSSTGSG